MVGSIQRILVEGPSRKASREHPDELMGRTENNRIANFAAGSNALRLIGSMVEVRIIHALSHSLRAELCVPELL